MKKALWNLVNGLLAGIMIAVGGTVFLACFGDGSMVNKTIGAFFFSIALLSICYKGYSLYTGKIGFIPEKHDGEAFSILLWGLLGNLIATVALGYALRGAIPTIGGVAEVLCTARLTQVWWQTLIRGIFCGILMYTAVAIYKEKGSPLGIFFCVPVFILSGFEPSIADMFYFFCARMFTGEVFLFLLLVVIGNAVGGMFIPALRLLAEEKKHG